MITPEMRAVMDEVMRDFRAGKLEPEKVPWWWEGRRDNELTPDYLGRVLEECGCEGMAAVARMGSYDDWHDEDGLGTVRLVTDLREAAVLFADHEEQIRAVENGVRRGEFDATKAEGDRWAASKVGRETMAAVTPRDRAAAQAIFDAIREKGNVGRNAPCPCGSGKKYKRCHGAPG